MYRGTYRLVRITGSAVRIREPITIHSASASVMFSGAESELNKVVWPCGAGRNLNGFRDGTNTTRNFQKKKRASDMPRKKVLKSCHSNPTTSKSAHAETETFLVGLAE